MQLEEVVLYLEIGSKSFKALMFKTTWRKVEKIIYENIKQSDGITVNGIEDFQLFTKCLHKFIYEIEYETSEKIQDIVIVYGGLLTTHITNVYKISVANMVKESDISRYKTGNLNNPTYEAVHYNYFFIADYFLYMSNPVGLTCTHLIVKQNYLALYKTIYQNILSFFETNDYNLRNIFFGPYVLAEYIRQYLTNFLIIDLGYYNCRICLIENNIMKEFYIVNHGLMALIEKLVLKYHYTKAAADQLIQNIDLLQNDSELSIDVQAFIINLLKKCFNLLNSPIVNSYDLPTFLNGFNNFQPIEYFLKTKLQRDFYSIASYFQWQKNYEYLYALHALFNKNR